MAVYLGSTALAGLHLGTTDVQKAYLGTTEIWSATTPPSYDAAATPVSTAGNGSFNFTATLNADVFVVACWQSSSTSITGVTHDGVAMSEIASVLHNNTASSGGTKVFRLANAGAGVAKSVSITTSGFGWFAFGAISVLNVHTVGTPTTSYGTGTAVTQSVPLTSGLVIQTMGAGGGAFGSFAGCTNRSNLNPGGGIPQAINTVTASATVSATNSVGNAWGCIAVPLT